MQPVNEGRIDEIGRALLAHARSRRPLPGSPDWFDDRGMAWTMADPRLKAACFRFVDALPHLADDVAIVDHLAEYLGPVADRLPALIRPLLGRRLWPLPVVVAGSARLAARRLAHRFIAGDTPHAAGTRLGLLRRRRWGFTIDLLGEAVLSEAEADAYAASYHALLDHLVPTAQTWADDDLIDRDDGGRIPRVNCSIKLTALTSRWDPLDPDGTTRRVLVRLRPILRRARDCGACVNIDMEHYACKDLTFAIVETVAAEAEFRAWPGFALAVQAYLHSAQDDLRRLLRAVERRGTPMTVRLVKGAYWDYETVMAAQRGWPVPVFTDKRATDANFEVCTEFLLRHRQLLRPAIAGHNVRSIAHTIACAEALGADPRSYEFQMLFGMVDPLKAAVVDLHRRVRVYAPFGELLPGMAYLVRRLLENTSNTSFVRAGFLEDASAEVLLMKPNPDAVAPEPAPLAGFRNEPLRDGSRAEVRQAMDAALQRVRSRLPIAIAPVVDGQGITSGPPWSWMNPSRVQECVAQGHFADAAVARRAVDAAAAGHPAWSQRSVDERAAILEQVAQRLSVLRDDAMAFIVFEVGKNRLEADADVAEAIDFCRYYAEQGRRILAPHRRDVPGELNEIRYESRGVAVVIAPWNFPLAILAGMAVANLMVGNTVILKPAEQASAVAQFLHATLLEAGVPATACHLLPGRGEDLGPELMADPRVGVVAFTGSRSVGLHLASEALRLAERKGQITKVVAEMGGKNAIIVDADADIDEAVQGVMASAFGFQGQKCSACSRVIVLDAIHDRFVERLGAAVSSLSAGPADDVSAVIGPVIDDDTVHRVQRVLAALPPPSRIAATGPRAEGGRYVAPVVVTGVAPEHSLAQEELFAPILAVIRVRDLDQALAVANGTPYALTGGCFTRSPATIARMRTELRVGNLYLNRAITGALVDRQPFGGFRLSGLGAKAGGADYLLQFVEARTLTENTLRHGFAVSRDESLL